MNVCVSIIFKSRSKDSLANKSLDIAFLKNRVLVINKWISKEI